MATRTLFDAEKFDGKNFRRWQEEIYFHLYLLNLDHMLHENALNIDENMIDYTTIIKKRKRDDFLCRGELLNAMVDSLFDFYVVYKTSSEMWNALEKIYSGEDLRTNISRRLNNNRMGDHRTIFQLDCACLYNGAKFNGKNFERWQHKILFHLTALNLDHMLYEDAFNVDENASDYAAIIEKRKQEDDLCRGYLLLAMVGSLFDIYSCYKTAYEIWNAVEKMYSWESSVDIVGDYLNYEMVDDKPVLAQVYELQTTVHRMSNKGIDLPRAFRVAAAIHKLPPSWEKIKSFFDDKWKDMTLEELFSHIRIKEENRNKGRLGWRSKVVFP